MDVICDAQSCETPALIIWRSAQGAHGLCRNHLDDAQDEARRREVFRYFPEAVQQAMQLESAFRDRIEWVQVAPEWRSFDGKKSEMLYWFRVQGQGKYVEVRTKGEASQLWRAVQDWPLIEGER